MAKKKKRRAPEWDDQAFRRRGPLGILGPNKELIEALTKKALGFSDHREDMVDAIYHGDKVVSFRARESGIDYKVVDSFSQTSLKRGGGIEHYCIIQQSHGDRLYGLLKYDPVTDKWLPAPIKFDKAADNRTGTLKELFIKNYEIIPGGIKYQPTISSRPITENTIWRK